MSAKHIELTDRLRTATMEADRLRAENAALRKQARQAVRALTSSRVAHVRCAEALGALRPKRRGGGGGR